MQGSVYLDYAATTPCDPRAVERMLPYLTDNFGNPSSVHAWGEKAANGIAAARDEMAATLGCKATEIVWTSGATESNNLAIRGAAEFWHKRKRHLITSKVEHRSVLDVFGQLEKEGFEVTYLQPDHNGVVQPDVLAGALRDDTSVVSLMHVNNEIGAVNDIVALGRIVRERGALFHVDAAQSLAYLPLETMIADVDLLSLSAHKFYGPKGVGALFVKGFPRAQVLPLLFGGGQEHGLRPGTLATHQIVAMAAAASIATAVRDVERLRTAALKSRFWAGLVDLPGVSVNGDVDTGAPHILSVNFAGINTESLLLACRDLGVSSGSACSAARSEVSHVLRALGRRDNAVSATLRFSFGRATSVADIDRAVTMVRTAVMALRAVAGDLAEANA